MGSDNQAQKIIDQWTNVSIALAVLDHAKRMNKGLTRVERDKMLRLLKHLRGTADKMGRQNDGV